MSETAHGQPPIEESVSRDAADFVADSDYIQVANEFATVVVRRVQSRNGARLEITSPKLGLSIFLDSTVLEGLTWQTPESFSLLLETPLEPLARRST
jgi:hypothetical protein